MPKLILREDLRREIPHPEVLYGRPLVHHEIASRLKWGHGDFPGDPHLAMYLNQQDNTWEIWRFELDGKYHRAAKSPPGARLGEDTWNVLSKHLQAHDTRNGFDPVAFTEKHNDALERRRDRDFDDKIADIASTYLYPAFRKVGFHNYL